MWAAGVGVRVRRVVCAAQVGVRGRWVRSVTTEQQQAQSKTKKQKKKQKKGRVRIEGDTDKDKE